jgi:aromatic-L-amino-acid/L-tryptophan decarboxylase
VSDAHESLLLPAEEMRALGYRVVDLLVEHLTTLPEQPVTGRASRAELEATLREPLPQAGRPPAEVLERLADQVLPFMMHVDHPRFFAFVPGPGNFVGAMADALVAGMNVFQGTWLASSGPSQVELVTLDWLRELCGLPAGAGGLMVGGGSAANLTALAVARHVRLGESFGRAVVYFSDQTHSSVERALRVLGFRADQSRRVASDDGFRLDPAALADAIAVDRAAGREPFCVVANAGTTNTGAVDPLDALADLCVAEGLWLHADGAYGAAAVLSERGRRELPGLGRVDSLSLDPHKWLFQPFEIGAVLVRDPRWLGETFRVLPEYLRDTYVEGEEVNFAERGIQLTRQFRALKLWMSLQVFGAERFARAIEQGFRLAEEAERAIRGHAGWRIVTPARMGIVSFRWAPDGTAEGEAEAVTAALVGDAFRDGFAMLSSTTLRGRTALRLCTINPRTTAADVHATVERLDRLARRRAQQARTP